METFALHTNTFTEHAIAHEAHAKTFIWHGQASARRKCTFAGHILKITRQNAFTTYKCSRSTEKSHVRGKHLHHLYVHSQDTQISLRNTHKRSQYKHTRSHNKRNPVHGSATGHKTWSFSSALIDSTFLRKMFTLHMRTFSLQAPCWHT